MGRSSPDEPIPAPMKSMVMPPSEVQAQSINGNGHGNGVSGQDKPASMSGGAGMGGKEEL
jgi:hypothetical protein